MYTLGTQILIGESTDTLTQLKTSDVFKKTEAEVVSIHKKVSPWLWILSVGGFAMAVWNKYEISSMYGSYKTMKKALLPARKGTSS
jgi:hypothetical protein